MTGTYLMKQGGGGRGLGMPKVDHSLINLVVSQITRCTGFESQSGHDFSFPVTFGGSMYQRPRTLKSTSLVGSAVVPHRVEDESN